MDGGRPDLPVPIEAQRDVPPISQELHDAWDQLRRQTAELESARQTLHAERQRFRELFQLAPEGYLTTDGNGTIREANRGAATLLNLPIEYLIGKPLVVFIDGGERKKFRVHLYRARADGAEEGWTSMVVPRDGEGTRAFLAVSPLLDSHGAVSGLRWLLRDTSGRRAGVIWDRTPSAVLRSALDAFSAHVVVIDADGTIVTANRAWRDAQLAAGLFEPADVGANYLALCAGAMTQGLTGAEIVREAVVRVLRGQDSRADALYCSAPNTAPSDGHAESADSWFSLRVTRCDGPEPQMVVVTHEDVTTERRSLAREQALLTERTARVAAEAASRAKSEFLATLSHELRTPLNAIAGYAQLLEMGVRGPITKQQAEDLRRILRSEPHLLGLINELLNFSRVERGDVDMMLTAVPVVDSAREVVELMEPQAAAKSLDITVECDDRELNALADADKLRQILLNLVTNAVKFTPRGGAIRVTCDGNESQVHVRVNDTGIGIPDAKLHLVFDPFVQVNRGSGSPSEGIGLGLAISRSLARALGGDLTVRSEPDKGSTFDLALPRATGNGSLS